MALKISAAAANAEINALTALLNTGFLRLYSGTRPATVAAAITGTLLASLPLSATAFGGGASGVATANAITSDTAADATGTATHYRVFASDGTTAHIDGDVSTSGSDLNLNSTAIQVGARVDVTSWTLTAGMG